MRRFLAVLLLLAVPAFASAVTVPSVTRRDGFLLLWNSLSRPADDVRKTFDDVPDDDAGGKAINYARSRGLLADASLFHPDDALTLQDALLLLFRTRNVDDPSNITPDALPGLLKRYPLPVDSSAYGKGLSADRLIALMRTFDEELAQEEHDVSLYGEEFQGANTAFGETFDLNAMTAAHRTFPYNTLVRVTNVENGKSVVVRINDRGPYVKGRDMDLSVAAFETIADRSRGHITARFERLGDATLVGPCTQHVAYQTKIGKYVTLQPGVPHVFRLGDTLTLASADPFVVHGVTYPDGTGNDVEQWITPGETYTFKPSTEGDYVFTIGSKEGRKRDFPMSVASCPPPADGEQ